MARFNPLSFTPGPVIFFVSATYIALFAALVVVHLRVPNYPSQTPIGTNLTEAWADLQHITRYFHPYNSRANDDVREYLLSRVQDIVTSRKLGHDRVQIIDDNIANATFSYGSQTIYFEGTNIIVAIRGSHDDEAISYTNGGAVPDRRRNNGAVLVNAHYDSVSSGFGATDDGVGVVTVLQLLSYFTEDANWPKRTVLLLLNNGEEDWLNGAKAFMRNNVSSIARTFVNLEGAGAGGRATLFRSTDTEVTKFYKRASHPFGTVISGDGFKKGLIRSETDYRVFNGELGLRGLDIAFMEPRARYHTIEDSTRETSLNSVWHMLSAALGTTDGLASVTGEQFGGSGHPTPDGRVDAGTGTDAVWFDIFGKVFVVFQLHTMFALCVTLLVVAPLALIGIIIGLSKADKNYLFSRKTYLHSSDDDDAMFLYGWRGFFRFPIVFVIASAAVVGLAYLVVRVNPYVVYSSPFAVWSMMISAWLTVAWFFSRGADAMRPSALHRLYALTWMFLGSFILLTLVTISVNNFQLGGGYFLMFYFASTSVATLVSYLELFFAPSKAAFARQAVEAVNSRRNSASTGRPHTGNTSGGRSNRSNDRVMQDGDATETTSLLQGDRRSFATYGHRRENEDLDDHNARPTSLRLGQIYPGEQPWSGKLPSWLWIIQFLLVAPVAAILVGQVALLVTSALYQTPADGSPSLFIYIVFAALTVLLLAPVGPFIHRFTFHLPMLLFLVCIGTLAYNLAAFPFSMDHRLKVYFVQRVDCETGVNKVLLMGLDGYVQRVIGDLPSAQGKHVKCTTPDIIARKELVSCSWEGIPATVVPRSAIVSNQSYVDSWLDYSVHKVHKSRNLGNVTIRVTGQNTRGCRLLFDTPVSHVAITGAAEDVRFSPVGKTGSRELRLWHREWSQPWDVHIQWDASEQWTLAGRVVCLWSDANNGEIPAFDEVQHYLPTWAMVTKSSDGLVEGTKHFTI